MFAFIRIINNYLQENIFSSSNITNKAVKKFRPGRIINGIIPF